MAWINGQWVEDKPGFGGMLGGFGGQPRFAEGYTGNTSLDVIGRPMPFPDFGRGGGVGDPTPQNPFQRPIYGQGPQMQPSPYQPTQWAGPNATYPNWNDPAGPFANDVAIMNVGQPPPSQNVGWNTGAISNVPGAAQRAAAARAAALNAQAQSRVSPPPPQLRPPLSPPDVSQYWPPGGDSIKPEIPTLGPELIFDPPPDWRPSTDHEFNVMQREKTKARLATDRAKTKKHYAKLRAQGASPKTIAKAKAKSKARSAKIKGQSVRRKTMS